MNSGSDTSGWTLSSAARHGGSALVLLDEQGEARALIHPPALDAEIDVTAAGWSAFMFDDAEKTYRARGSLAHATGEITYSLDVIFPGDVAAAPLRLDWHVEFGGGAVAAALRYTVTLPGVAAEAGALDLPSLYYAGSTYGTGMFPRPDPARGFAFRADRMGQPAIHYSTPRGAWSYMLPGEAPIEVEPELLYSLGMAPSDGGLDLFCRYPQYEYGHRGDGGADAYVAKNTFAPGERLSRAWEPGSTQTTTMYLWCRPPGAAHDYGAPARFLWRDAYPRHAAAPTTLLWEQAARRIGWYNARLFNPALGGGQYESPEGSGTAMLGFVEQSLMMAATTLIYASLSRGRVRQALSAAELDRFSRQAAGALTRWVRAGQAGGISPLLHPACDREGYVFGWRDYGDYETLRIVQDGTFDTIRLASEARMLFRASLAAASAGGIFSADARLWFDAAAGIASWLRLRPLPGGGYPGRFTVDGAPVEPYPAGTGMVISLFCDCAHLLPDWDLAADYLREARHAYDKVLSAMLSEGVFAGGTLDASTTDREAAIADLDAVLDLYELTGEESYLAAARKAADNVLSYTMVYPIATFAPGTDAARMGISTFGASIVSPENQHLDPVPTAGGLLRYGLYAGDEVCVQAAVESLKWCLDGRWAVQTPDGLKQSEQLLNTRWYYNTFFSQRGDFRRGMPVFGRRDSEHGWPQVVPSAALLALGQVVLDWPTGRAAGVDGWQVEDAASEPEGDRRLSLTPMLPAPGEGGASCLLKVLRLPGGSRMELAIGDDLFSVAAAELAHGYTLNLPAEGSSRLRLCEER